MNKKQDFIFSGLRKISRPLSWFNLKITVFSILLLAVIFSFAVMPVLAIDTGLQYGTYTGLGTQDLRVTIMKIVRIGIGFLGVIAILLILYAGYMWMTSAGNEEKIDTAKRIIRNAIIGLLIIFLAFAIVSFIINIFASPSAPGQPTPPGPPVYDDGQLGSGIIESVFPAPYTNDVARNTNIMVTFKVPMDVASIIDGNNIKTVSGKPVVLIYPYSATAADHGASNALPANQVRVTAANGDRTFIFDPDNNLGNEVNNTWYEVKLTGSIAKANGQSAFPSGKPYFAWPFEVGTFLDLNPVTEENVFPEPDNQADIYSPSAGTQATAVFTVNHQPKVATVASYNQQAVATAGTVGAVVSGSYNGTVAGTITVTLNGDTAAATASVVWPLNNGQPNSNNKDNVAIIGSAISLGSGLALTINGNHVGDNANNQWEVRNLVPAASADTLRIANKTYIFGSGISDITVGADVAATIANIVNKINIDTQNPDVEATASGNQITGTSQIAGATGNFSVSLSSDWGTINSITAGTDSSFSVQVKSAADKPRNTVIRLDFSEAINPVQANGNNILIQYKTAPTSDWQTVLGSYLLSNQYRTVEFLTASQCGSCSQDNNVVCSQDSDCGSGNNCKLLTNSCGDKIYCLPVTTNPTAYRVIVKAGLLKTCTAEADCKDGSYKTCADLGNGSAKACQGSFTFGSPTVTVSAFYPESAGSPQGITDAANNSFNGNKNTYTINWGTPERRKVLGSAQGPGKDTPPATANQSNQSSYSLNKVCSQDAAIACLVNSDCVVSATNKGPCVNLPDSQGDDLVWNFYINKQLDLTPPVISSISPTIGAASVSLTAPIEAMFNKLLMSSTLKPGSDYSDGYCYCATTAGQPDNNLCRNQTDHSCEATSLKCKANEGKEQIFCTNDNECASNRCWNKKYVSLVNKATFPVGWWVTNQGLDINSPLDTYADISRVLLEHTKFPEVTQYGTELGSGIKDVYQNCYIPASGPALGFFKHCKGDATACSLDNDCGNHQCIICDANTGVGCCNVLPNLPYCCNGTALSRQAWETSACYSGY